MKKKLLLLLLPLLMVACATSSSSENTSLVNPFDSSSIDESKNDITTEETSSEDKPSSEVPPAVTKYTVSGKLVDDKGNAIPDATLKLSNSTFTSMSLTNVNGEFTFNDVKAGTYTISITNLENDKWNIEKFTPVTVEVSGTNVNFVVDNVVVPASDIIWGPMFGGN